MSCPTHQHGNTPANPNTTQSRWDHPRTAAALLFGLCLFHLVANLIWLRLDHHVVRIDEGFHVRGAQAYFDVLTSPFYRSLADRVADLTEIFSPYPPALHILGALLALAFGYSHDVVALSGAACLILIILGSYAIARRLLDQRYALLTAALVSFIPLYFAGSRYVVLENLVAACVLWAIYALLRTDGFRCTRWTLIFALINGIAILTKQNAFAYYLVPAAAVFGYGLWVSLVRPAERRQFPRVLLNGFLTVLVSAGIFAPWYYHHLPALEEYWLHEHKGGTTPFTFVEPEEAAPQAEAPAQTEQPDAPDLPAPVQPAESPATEQALTVPPVAPPAAPPLPEPDQAQARPDQSISDLSEVVQERPWRRYFINFVNNGVFLPYFLLSVAGLAVMLWQRRYWGQPLYLLLLWGFGSYLLMTLVFRHITPRYALPFIAPMAFFAAGALYSIPGLRWRRGAMGVVVALLLLQFLHLSFGPLLRPAQLWIPLLKDSRTAVYYLDEGLALYKDRLVVGTYTFTSPYRDINYVDRLLEGMRAREEEMQTPPGAEVPYLALWRQRNFGGLQLAERQYWPEPNPMLRADLEDPAKAKFRLYNYQVGMAPDELLPVLDEAPYVAVFLGQSAATELDGPHHHFYQALLDARPMQVIDYFAVPEYGKLPAAYIGLLAAKEHPLSMRPFNVFEMYTRRELSAFDPEVADQYRAHYEETFYQGVQWVEMTDAIEYGLISFRPVSGMLLHYKALFRCKAPMESDLRLFVEVIDQAGNRLYWNATPDPSTSQWQPGEYYVLERYIARPAPGPYLVRLGFFTKQGVNIVTDGEVINAGQTSF